MEYDYHIFLKYLEYQTENIAFQMKNLVSISIGNLRYQLKNSKIEKSKT